MTDDIKAVKPEDEKPNDVPPDPKPEPPRTGYALEGNFEQPASFPKDLHDPNADPDDDPDKTVRPAFDPAYGNNPYKGGFHRDRQGNEIDHLQVTVKGENIPPG